MTDIAKTLKPGQRITVRAPSPTGTYTSLPLVELKAGDSLIVKGDAACPPSLQALVDAASPGSTLTIPACTFRETVTVKKPLTLVTVGGKIDGEGVRPYGFVVVADDVTIDGFEVTGTTTPKQDGAIRARNGNHRFTLRNAHVHHTGGSGISIKGGSGHKVLDSEFAYCEQQGYHVGSVSGLLFARNHVHHNNPNHTYESSWEAGAGKFSNSSGVVFDGNEVAYNNGPGLWCDINVTDATFRNNRIHHNEKAGIFFEISDGALIHDNIVWENAWTKPGWAWGAGILVSSSRNVEIRNNVVAWNPDGISVISQQRAGGTHFDSNTVVNVNVHDNDVITAVTSGDTSGKYLLAWLMDWAGTMFDPASNNRGAGNRYWYSASESSARFAWNRTNIGRLADFNATPGEEGGRYLTVTERDAVLTKAGIPLAAER